MHVVCCLRAEKIGPLLPGLATHCLTLDKLLSVHMPQFPHLKMRTIVGIYVVGRIK